MSTAAQSNQAGARAAEPEGFAAARGYAALRESVERKLREARRKLAWYPCTRWPSTNAALHGRIGALEDVLEMIDGTKTAPHTAKLSDCD